MKKIKLFAMFALLIGGTFLLTGCADERVEGSLEELMEKVYSPVAEDERPMMLGNTIVTEENVEYYLGSADIEFEEAIASESMTGSIAHSIVLMRAKENADIEKIKTTIKENINPTKWICVGVEEDQVVVKNRGDLIILIMSEKAEDYEKGFDEL